MVVARIPNPNAGSAGLTTASEAATLEHVRNLYLIKHRLTGCLHFLFTLSQLREILNIPVPKVLAWSADAEHDNPVDCEYLIMEHAPGVDSGRLWPEMELEQKFQTMKDIVEVQSKLLSVHFRWCVYLEKLLIANLGALSLRRR